MHKGLFNKKQPLLSIVLPTYERVNGLEFLLSKIDNNLIKDGVIELIVSDDSFTDLVEVFCHDIQYLTYIKHNNTSNPIDNWNNGLKFAKGLYIQVLHHDEYPAKSLTYNEIIDSLAGRYYDVLIPRCHFIKGSGEVVARFAQSSITQRMALHFPYLLLGFNVIGSPSLFIYINKGEIFDRNLTYLVDVVFYFKKFKNFRKVGEVILSDSVFLSDTTFDKSITKSLKKTWK